MCFEWECSTKVTTKSPHFRPGVVSFDDLFSQLKTKLISLLNVKFVAFFFLNLLLNNLFPLGSFFKLSVSPSTVESSAFWQPQYSEKKCDFEKWKEFIFL